MCFYSNETTKAIIAKKDIKCWKLLEDDNAPFYGRNIDRYETNVLNPHVNIVPIHGLIHEGYHSCKKKETLEELEPYWFETRDANVKEFVIPKGTRYYENSTQYVSETIMLVE